MKTAKMENLSQKELKKIEKMQYLSRNKLEKIAKTRGIEGYNCMSKENLLIVLLKSEQNITELRKSKYNNTEREDNRKIFNEQRNILKK